MLELRRAVRRLTRAPRHAAAIVLTLATAVGAASAIFAIVDAVLWRPLPLRAPEQLVLVWESAPSRGLRVVELSHGSTRRWTSETRSFLRASALGSSPWPGVLRHHGEPVRVAITAVGGTFFDTLGTDAHSGRLLTPQDDVAGAQAVTVVAHGAWVRLLGADPDVVGTTLVLDVPRVVVGILPREFDVPRGTDFWIPVVPALTAAGSSSLDILEHVGVLFVLGRLAPGVSAAGAAAELEGRAAASGPGSGRRFGERIVVTPLLDELFGPLRAALWTAWAASGLLVLIAAANVSSLLLASALLRAHGDAVQVALGAQPRDLRRQWRADVIVLASVAGAVGLALAWLLVRLTVAVAPADLPRLGEVTLGWRVPVFTLAVLTATALLAGRRPAAMAARAHALAAMTRESRSTSSLDLRRRRHAFMMCQVLLSVVLLGAAGLVLRSIVKLRNLDLGFTPGGATAVFVDAPDAASMEDILARLRGSTRVAAVGATSLRPLEFGPIGSEAAVVLEGQVDTPAVRQANPTLNHLVVTPGYFEAMGTPVVKGRAFLTSDDARSMPVAIVGASAARRLWADGEAVGRRLVLPTAGGAPPPWRTVVGVVTDMHYRGIGDPRLDVYEPALQSPAGLARHVIVRSDLGTADVAALVRTEARRADGRVVVDQIQPLSSTVDRALRPWLFAGWVLGAFAIAGGALAGVGLFGVTGLEVAARRRELALRIALGGTPRVVAWQVLAPVLTRAAIALVAGVATALVLLRAARGLLFGVGSGDPVTWLAVGSAVLVLTTLAAWLPARPLLRKPPAEVLREE